MRKSFDDHEFGPSLLAAADYREVSIVFPVGGINLKARIDLCISKSGVVCDGKKVQYGHGNPDVFGGDLTERQYHVQAATYMLAAAQIPGCVPAPLWRPAA